MWVVVLHPYTKFKVRRQLPFGRYGARCVSALIGLVTLTFDRLTLKLVCESHLKWETFVPNLGTLDLWVVELFAMYATNGQTDRRTDRSNAYCALPYGRGHIKEFKDWLG